MYRGFKIKSLGFIHPTDKQRYYSEGKATHEKNKAAIRTKLREFMYADNSLDGTAIQKAWFPQIKADVFISYSHDDGYEAIALAGWLFSNFGLRSFVDSCAWGYANTLLREIDNKFSMNVDNKTFNYQKLNLSSSHVHMMLCSALSMMMDNCECLIFLDTPNSIQPVAGISKTDSPWLYYEIALSQVLRKQPLTRLLNESEQTFSKGGELTIRHTANLNHLSEITQVIANMLLRVKGKGASFALNTLYQLLPAPMIKV